MNAPLAIAPYSVHDGEAARDREAVLQVWRGMLGDEAGMAAKYDWFYLASPLGRPLLKLLRHERDQALAGACAAGHRRMRLRGRELSAGLLVDFAVRPEHRSLGPALALQLALLQTAQQQFDLVYGFPNRKAETIFRRLGWHKIAEMVRYTRVLRHGPYLSRRLPSLIAMPVGALVDAAHWIRDALARFGLPRAPKMRWSALVDPRMDALWDNSRQEAMVAVRDVAYLRWRFDDCPLARSRYLLLVCPESDKLVAWFAVQVDGRQLKVRDCWSCNGTDGMAAAHVDCLVQAARAAGHDSVSVELAMTDERLAGWRSKHFVERSKRPIYGVLADPDVATHGPYLTAADEDQ